MHHDLHKQKGVKISTNSVAQTIEHFCKEKNIPVSKIDFELLSFKTEAFFEDEGTPPKLLPLPMDKKIWQDTKISIRQSYEIFLHLLEIDKDMQLHLSFGGNKHLTTIVAFIKPDSKLTYSDELAKSLEEELNKRKLKMGVMIGVFDECMKEDIQKLCEFLKSGGKITHDYKIELFCAPEFVPSKDDYLEFLFQKNSLKGQKKGVYSAKAGQTLILYQKARAGVPSRDAKGRILEPSTPTEGKKPELKCGDGVDVFDSESETVYKAKKTGFIILGENEIDVKEEMSLNEVNIKTGSIDAGIDSDSKLEITDDNPNSEAIGDNLTVRASVVNVSGSVGASALVDAKSVDIGGQTHKTSKIKAKKAHIKNHKGFLEAEEAIIDTLEGGEVVAKKVTITTAVGGKVRADECRIATLGSNNEIICTKLIEIENPLGGENRLIVEAAANSSDMKALEEIQGKLLEIEDEIASLEEFVKKERTTIEQQSKSVPQIKAKIEEEKKKNSPLANVLVAKLKHFAADVEKLREAEKKVSELRESKNSLLAELNTLQCRVLDAKIVARSPWKGFNSASFRLLYPKREFAQKIEEGSELREILLRQTGEGEYEIHSL